MATRTQIKAAPLMLSPAPADQTHRTTARAPSANDPIAKLRAKVSPAQPAQADQVIPPRAQETEKIENEDESFLDDDFLPDIGGPLIVGAHVGLTAKILKRMGRTCDGPDDERKDKASTKASAWLRIKLGNTIKLGPTGQMFVCLLGLSGTMYLESEPIAQATPSSPPPPKPAQPTPAAPAPVAPTQSAPRGNTARDADTDNDMPTVKTNNILAV